MWKNIKKRKNKKITPTWKSLSFISNLKAEDIISLKDSRISSSIPILSGAIQQPRLFRKNVIDKIEHGEVILKEAYLSCCTFNILNYWRKIAQKLFVYCKIFLKLSLRLDLLTNLLLENFVKFFYPKANRIFEN